MNEISTNTYAKFEFLIVHYLALNEHSRWQALVSCKIQIKNRELSWNACYPPMKWNMDERTRKGDL